MEEDKNNVEIVFKDGDSISVQFAARLVGAEWVLAEILIVGDDGNGDSIVDDVIIRADDIRYIRSRNTIRGNEDRNTRIHYGNEWNREIAHRVCERIFKAQDQLHPNSDPSAFPMSERGWPPETKS